MKRTAQALAVLFGLLSAGCQGSSGSGATSPDEPLRDRSGDRRFSELAATPDWTPATHGKLSTGAIRNNLAAVFDNGAVQELTVVIEAENWQVMQRNLADLKAVWKRNPSDYLSLPDPIYVPCEVFHNGTEWYKVAIRYKGNSTLYLPTQQKLPFKLKFNEFGGTYPAVADQRFYGFKTLHLKNNFRDRSQLREVLTADLFRDWGLAGPHASFYRLYVDCGDGNGKKYFGLYTLVEDVEDTVIKTQYADGSGNLYKPEGPAARFAPGTFDTEGFYLKNNEAGADFADVSALYEAINDSGSYANDRAAWKAALEGVFDTSIFLKWVAANTVIQNWDAYGVMAKNYYLFHNKSTGLLEWIPWDNNEALKADSKCPGLDLSSVGRAWPLISFLAGDPDYFESYRTNVLEFSSGLFATSRMASLIDEKAALIGVAVGEELPGYSYASPSKFTAEVERLKAHVASRNAAAAEFALR